MPAFITSSRGGEEKKKKKNTQSHPSYSRKLRGSTSSLSGISKDPSACSVSIRKNTVEYSIPRAISIRPDDFPARDRVNENIILVVRGLVRPVVQPIPFCHFCIPRPSSRSSFLVLPRSAPYPVLPSANYSRPDVAARNYRSAWRTRLPADTTFPAFSTFQRPPRLCRSCHFSRIFSPRKKWEKPRVTYLHGVSLDRLKCLAVCLCRFFEEYHYFYTE